MMKKKAIILINELSDNPTEDEKDVIDQAEHVEKELLALGYSTGRLFTGLDLGKAKNNLMEANPQVVFNLVEGIEGNASLIHFAPALLESLKIPFTGCAQECMFITSNKVLTKKLLKFNGIRTADFFSGIDDFSFDPLKTYIAKPLWEDASVGITDKSVFSGNDGRIINEYRKKWGNGFFVEEFIDGREYNVAVLGGEKGPEVMPLAEMLFNNFPEGKPKIVGYSAKWDEGTFEYSNTVRTFDYSQEDDPLREEIREMAMQCWHAFGVRGYCRVDFRVDRHNKPYVLEINANPCLSEGAGFFVACNRAGLDFKEVVRRIIYDAFI